MRRLARGLFNTMVALSLLLCLGFAGVWVRSYFMEDLVGPGHAKEYSNRMDYRWLLATSRGRIGLTRQHYPTFDWAGPGDQLIHKTQRPRNLDDSFGGTEGFRLLGFAWRSWFMMHGPQIYSGWQLAVPFWALCAVTAAAPAMWARGWLRRKRLGPGLCPTCGYDLRATPERCPECGRPVQQVVAEIAE
jgi:hypothetical protein